MHVWDMTAALEYTLRNTLSSSALFLQATESCMNGGVDSMVWVQHRVSSIGHCHYSMNSCDAALRVGWQSTCRQGQKACIHVDKCEGMASSRWLTQQACLLTSRTTGQMRLSSAEGSRGLLLCAVVIPSSCSCSDGAELHAMLLLSVSLACSVTSEVPL